MLEFWSVILSGPTNSAHVAHVTARLQATWAEVVGPGGMTDPFMILAIHMYLFQLRNFQIYSNFH